MGYNRMELRFVADTARTIQDNKEVIHTVALCRGPISQRKLEWWKRTK